MYRSTEESADAGVEYIEVDATRPVLIRKDLLIGECRTCGAVIHKSGTMRGYSSPKGSPRMRCTTCFEVEARLENYLEHPEGESFVARALAEALAH